MYEQSAIILRKLRNRVDEFPISISFINERTPFYFISTAFLFVAIILSLITTLQQKDNYNDFFQNLVFTIKMIHDSTIVDKLCWYFSQITHHTLILLFLFFLLSLTINQNNILR